MRALLWTIAALVAVLGFVGIIASLSYGGPQLGRPIMIMPKDVSTTQYSPEASNSTKSSATAQLLPRTAPSSR
jgi:hypothetical protein